MALAAVVVCHNSEDSKLRETLAALSKHKDLELFVAALEQPSQLFGATYLAVTSSTFEGSLAQALDQLGDFEWVWSLSDYQVPEADALNELLAVAETSTTAAVIAPKLMSEANPKLISKFGLTLTSRSSLHSLADDDLDQAQFDNLQDYLGASLEGALIAPQQIKAVGGFAKALQAQACDVELGVRLRLNGKRVLLAPKAKVTGSDPSRQLERAQDMQLKLFYYSGLAAFAFWLFLPFLLLIEVLWLLVRKQPEKIATELAAGLKAFFTAYRIAAARRILHSRDRRNLKKLKPLLATKQQVADARAQKLISDIDVQVSEGNDATRLGFFRSGAFWVSALLLIASWQYWPQDVDATAAALIPSGDSWLNIFTATGSGFQNLGTGFFAPSEPFNWVLLTLASLTPWSAGIAVVVLFFLAKSVAFASAFKTASLVTNRLWLAILSALIYAFWPAFTVAQSEGRLAQVVTHIMLPVVVFALVKLLDKEQLSRQSNWAFTALAALSAAVLSVAAPVLTIFLAIAWVLFAIFRFKKIGYLVWIPVPLVVLWLPTIWFRVAGLGKPMSLLADPGLALNSAALSAPELLVAGWATDWVLANSIGFSLLLLVALLALFRKVLLSLWLLAGFAVSLFAAWAFQAIQFANNSVVGEATGDAWVSGSPHSLLSVCAILIVILTAVALDGLKPARAIGMLAYPSLAVLGLFAVLLPSTLKYSDGRVVPALIRAEAKQNSSLKVLLIRPEESGNFSATLLSKDGIHMVDLNTSYRFALVDQDFSEIAQLAADIVSASEANLGEKLKASGIGYVLVPTQNTNADRQLISNIDSVRGLKSIGLTDYGQLWRLADLTEVPIAAPTNQDLWSVTKGVQLSVLLAFALLAVPTRRRQIFKASGESNSQAIEEVELDA
ncbi:MAG: hypothetical protein ACKOWE_02855 [Micrococcales bacterium]